MRARPCLHFVLASVFSVLVLAGCGGGFFKDVMEGKNGSARAGSLKISPATATLVCGAQLQLAVTGGDGDYSFSFTGSGSFDKSTMLYTAPSSEGIDRLQVTDGAGTQVVAVLSVKSASSPDYRVATSPSSEAPVFPGSGAGGGAFSGSFFIENIAGEKGTQAVDWKVYVSRDNAYDSLDLLAASGSIAALGASSVSSVVSYTGVWPTASDSYYIIITLAASDDGNSSNDVLVGSATAISGSARPDYSITSIAAPSSGLGGGSCSGALDVSNIGAGPGSETASWAVYLSTDTTYDSGDALLASGTLPSALVANTAAPTISFTGTYPTAPGTYYCVAKVSAFDDATTGTKALTSSPILVSGPDYAVSSVATPTGNTAGQAISGSFVIGNAGLAAGHSAIAWKVYASLADAALDAGDSLIASGTTAALAASGTVTVNYSGTWPSAAGSYYLIATVSADDDTGAASLASSSVTVSNPDYTVSAFGSPSALSAGQSFTGSFTLRNAGSGNGSSSVAWSVYASLANNSLDSGDSLIASGTHAALSAGGTAVINYSGGWPSTPGSYYLIVKLSAADDPSDATLSSGSTTVSGPDYRASTFSAPSSYSAGTAFTGTFSIENIGLGAGNKSVAWSIYLSADASFGTGDSLLDSGSTTALSAGGTVSINYSGTWSSTAGTYYLIVRLAASDDANSANDSSASSAITTL
jgi:hypothetical protein